MPSNEDFSLSVLVGNTVLPEYSHGGVCYVECDLFSPVSFKQQTEERVGQELEVQEQPVTPFSICLVAKPSRNVHQRYYYRVFIDGQKVTARSVQQGQNKYIKGFRDNNTVKEFLFSMPSLKQSQIQSSSSDRVGWIDVECWNATLKTSKKTVRNKQHNFTPGSKKDSLRVTQGKYMMTTTKVGRVLQLKNMYRTTDFWDLISLRSKLSVKYVTAHGLTDMGMTVVPIPYPSTLRRGRSQRHGQSQGVGQQESEQKPIVDLSNGLAGTAYDNNTQDKTETKESIVVDSNCDVVIDGSVDLTAPDPEVKIESEDGSGTDSLNVSSEGKKRRKGVPHLGTDLVINLCDLEEEAGWADNEVIVLD